MPDPARRAAARDRLLARMPKGGVAAEIGVWEGAFSRRILEVAAPRELHLIDPWAAQREFPNTRYGRSSADQMEAIHRGVVATLGSDPRVHIHRALSEDALAGFPDAYFDWVYVDGNHNAPFVDRDLALCAAKVRPGGIIAGDDYRWQAGGTLPVMAAVERLMQRLTGARLRLIANQYLIRLPAA